MLEIAARVAIGATIESEVANMAFKGPQGEVGFSASCDIVFLMGLFCHTGTDSGVIDLGSPLTYCNIMPPLKTK